MTKTVFRSLCNRLSHRLSQRKSSIPVPVKIAVTLRYLGGGSFYDVIDIFRIGSSTFWAIKDEVIAAIIAEYTFEYAVNDEAMVAEIAAGFRQKSREGVFANCIGAIDGWYVFIVTVNTPVGNHLLTYICFNECLSYGSDSSTAVSGGLW